MRVRTGFGFLLAIVAAVAGQPLAAEVSSGNRAATRQPQVETPPRVREKGATRMIIAGRKVDVWQPASGDGRSPLILFSHGFSGCGTQSRFLMRALSDAGYLVVAPNHADARCTDGRRKLFGKLPRPAFHSYRRWSEASYSDRRDDMREVMEAVLADPSFQADRDRIGLVGHSLGGYTVLGLAGAWSNWGTPGIKAVVALSPWCAPLAASHSLGGVDIPR